MEYIYLMIAGICEVFMVYSLNKSNGFKVPSWTVFTLLAAGLSLATLSLAMTNLEAGVAYSIWVAFGSIGSIVLGYFAFHDKVNLKQILFMAIVVVAVIGLKVWG